jgi:hypothetical protein
MSNLKEIYSFLDNNQAYVAKSYLESNDIKVVLLDEITSQVYPLANNAFGGIKIAVPDDQAEEAVQLLDEGGFIK